MRRPTRRQIEAALSVTLWLSEREESDGELRDCISVVRDALWDEVTS